MRLRAVHLQDFRNIAFTSLRFEGPRQFLLGPNGQGKTNLLEAVGLLTALRSFRTQELRPLIRQGQSEARLRFELDHERDGPCDVLVSLKSGEREVSVNEALLPRLADFVGRFPAVVFSSEDIQLLRGAPALRRKLLDLTLSVADPAYFAALRRYHQALKGRNALLRDPRATDAALASFEHPLAPEAASLAARRAAGVGELAEDLRAAYAMLSGAAAEEAPDIVYRPDVADVGDTEGFARLFASNRARDREALTTSRGPHRDDLTFRLKGRAARDFASEGQQRGLVVALRLAQATFFARRTGIQPLVLADDVLGELDPVRREGFWRAVGSGMQVVATGTEPPAAPPPGSPPWQFFDVQHGVFSAPTSPTDTPNA